MSDDPYNPWPRLMTPEAARDIARMYKSLADAFQAEQMTRQALRAQADSQWWLTYALTLSQTKRPGE